MSLTIAGETKIDSEPCVVAWNDKLFVGTDAGSILTFDSNLSPGASWTAHAVQLFALTASDGKLYSASNDGGIRIWTYDGQKISELPIPDADVESICTHGNYVYAGDELGNIYVFENNSLIANYNVLEEVKDLAICPPLMFTVRDLYVTVTEIKPEKSKDRFATVHVMEGRAPLQVSGSHLVVTSRGGNSIQLHEMDLGSKFKKLDEVKVSEMILTSMSVREDFVWTGGWDGCAKRWRIDGEKLLPAGEINLGVCINAVIAVNGDNAYALLSGGRIIYIKAA
ncbi:uncharacterized protein LOC112052578 [Bicyclus anynana]|uniref:Uncharacterized protein LOC112052578 n=1 Tax=Bicyclus anynana TaxID=110368 RepID=A0A6J1NQS6_BICAN|nr:uncharacterized protein LOC112052578 [Bicyclus anynana]